MVFALSIAMLAWSQSAKAQSAPSSSGDSANNKQTQARVPTGVILVKGAWSSEWPGASDSVTPVPEAGSVANNVFRDPYFGITYPLPSGWTEKYKGPPPSDTGRYVLAEIGPAGTLKGSARGSILITAQDLFFTPVPAANALQLINYEKDNLQSDYKVERPPAETKIAGRSFTFFTYWSPVAQLHWYVLATQMRCHAVQIVLTSRDTKLLESLIHDMNNMKLPTEATAGTGAGDFPVCVKDYARDENMIAKVDPVFAERRFNPVPVRIIIDKEGNVKHIHFLSAFPGQAKAITDALGQWKFKPYLQHGHPVEVETGIMFGRPPSGTTPGG